jgi:hypothetical protein
MEPLTHRERLLRTLRFQPVDRVPDYEFGMWLQTVDRWRQEGLETPVMSMWGPLENWFGTDSTEFGPGLPLNTGLLPAFETVILEDKGTHQIIQDSDGAISEQMKPEYGASIPHYLRYAIESRADWERMRDERLDPNHPERLPRHLDPLLRRLRRRDYPLSLWLGSLYGFVRNWMGVERLSLMVYDDRPLVEEIMEHLTQTMLTVVGKLAGKGLEVDQGDWWEDMCYNSGPLLTPRLFRELMVPRYKRVTDFLRQEFGTEFNQLDCDGNIHQLVPLWFEGGINVMFPVESAHTDAFRIAQEYGTRMPMRGVFDKRALIAGPAAIDAEFERLQPLLERGGLIPHTDHLVPPDVSLANYTYYRRRKCEIIGKPWREPGLRHKPGYLLNWRLLGPFDNERNGGFHAEYPPESNPASEKPVVGRGGTELRWRPYRGTAASGYVDLCESVSHEPWVLAYAACALYAPTARDGWLELGSDDGVQVWLNGEQVWNKDVYRVAVPGQDLLPVHLRQGWNQVLVKVGQAEGDWGFYFRLTDDDGQPWTDLEWRA